MSRREPDFESAFPSISASSRGKNFAPCLRPGDTVVYTTTKGRWGPAEIGRVELHWRLVAVLEVFQRFETHDEAARWYRGQGLAVPGNCVVEGNPPLPTPLSVPRG